MAPTWAVPGLFIFYPICKISINFSGSTLGKTLKAHFLGHAFDKKLPGAKVAPILRRATENFNFMLHSI